MPSLLPSFLTTHHDSDLVNPTSASAFDSPALKTHCHTFASLSVSLLVLVLNMPSAVSLFDARLVRLMTRNASTRDSPRVILRLVLLCIVRLCIIHDVFDWTRKCKSYFPLASFMSRFLDRECWQSLHLSRMMRVSSPYRPDRDVSQVTWSVTTASRHSRSSGRC